MYGSSFCAGGVFWNATLLYQLHETKTRGALWLGGFASIGHFAAMLFSLVLPTFLSSASSTYTTGTSSGLFGLFMPGWVATALLLLGHLVIHVIEHDSHGTMAYPCDTAMHRPLTLYAKVPVNGGKEDGGGGDDDEKKETYKGFIEDIQSNNDDGAMVRRRSSRDTRSSAQSQTNTDHPDLPPILKAGHRISTYFTLRRTKVKLNQCAKASRWWSFLPFLLAAASAPLALSGAIVQITWVDRVTVWVGGSGLTQPELVSATARFALLHAGAGTGHLLFGTLSAGFLGSDYEDQLFHVFSMLWLLLMVFLLSHLYMTVSEPDRRALLYFFGLFYGATDVMVQAQVMTRWEPLAPHKRRELRNALNYLINYMNIKMHQVVRRFQHRGVVDETHKKPSLLKRFPWSKLSIRHHSNRNAASIDEEEEEEEKDRSFTDDEFRTWDRWFRIMIYQFFLVLGQTAFICIVFIPSSLAAGQMLSYSPYIILFGSLLLIFGVCLRSCEELRGAPVQVSNPFCIDCNPRRQIVMEDLEGEERDEDEA